MYRVKVIANDGLVNIDIGRLVRAPNIATNYCGLDCHDQRGHCKLFDRPLKYIVDNPEMTLWNAHLTERCDECFEAEKMFERYGKLAE